MLVFLKTYSEFIICNFFEQTRVLLRCLFKSCFCLWILIICKESKFIGFCLRNCCFIQLVLVVVHLNQNVNKQCYQREKADIWTQKFCWRTFKVEEKNLQHHNIQYRARGISFVRNFALLYFHTMLRTKFLEKMEKGWINIKLLINLLDVNISAIYYYHDL